MGKNIRSPGTYTAGKETTVAFSFATDGQKRFYAIGWRLQSARDYLITSINSTDLGK
jgi:hypothetical protein